MAQYKGDRQGQISMLCRRILSHQCSAYTSTAAFISEDLRWFWGKKIKIKKTETNCFSFRSWLNLMQLGAAWGQSRVLLEVCSCQGICMVFQTAQPLLRQPLVTWILQTGTTTFPATLLSFDALCKCQPPEWWINLAATVAVF